MNPNVCVDCGNPTRGIRPGRRCASCLASYLREKMLDRFFHPPDVFDNVVLEHLSDRFGKSFSDVRDEVINDWGSCSASKLRYALQRLRKRGFVLVGADDDGFVDYRRRVGA